MDKQLTKGHRLFEDTDTCNEIIICTEMEREDTIHYVGMVGEIDRSQ